MQCVLVLLDSTLEKVGCSNPNFKLSKGDVVIVFFNGCLYSGQVIGFSSSFPVKNKIVRKADNNDFRVIRKNEIDSKRSLVDAKKFQKKLNLNMSFVDAYYTVDRKQLYFLFVADNRVDFRELAKKLADKYRTRIELRQIGIRDEAKLVGGIGPCGLFLCCNSFLTDFNSVSINMAKNQFLALNPSKINGVCGRLLCCLNYEDDTYKELRKVAPKIGSSYQYDKKEGKVVAVDIFKEECSVEFPDKSVIKVNYGKDDEDIK